MKIRFVSAADSAALLQIYAQYIDTPITFECELPSKEAFAARIRDISREYPYLVCEEGGRIVGYAYAHRQRERAAYQWNAELSVYLDGAYTGKGLGKNFYQILMELLRFQGIRNVYGCVTLPNEKSEGLHVSMGFERSGTFHNTGYKCGKWQDVAWFEKAIAPYGTEPVPIVPICSLPVEKLETILPPYQR